MKVECGKIQRKVNYYCVYLSCLLFFVSSCSEVIDLNTKAVNQRLVIDGRITDGTAGNIVRLAFTSPINGNQEPISDADVTLLENELPIADYREEEAGFYRLNYNDSASAGNSYQLRVVLPDGRTYRSTPSVMPGLVAVDIPRFDASAVEVVVNQEGVSVEQNLVRLFVDTDIIDQSKDFYLTWNIIAAYSYQERIRNAGIPPPPCYVINDVTGQEIQLFNGAEIKVDRVPDRFLASTKIDSRFAFDFYYSVIQSTVDESAYEYLSLINEISNTQGSIFDKPAAPVPGNFRNLANPDEEVLGYFFVSRSDTTRVRLRSEDVPGFVTRPCPRMVDYSQEPSSCLNCLLIKNSTHDRPYYWF